MLCSLLTLSLLPSFFRCLLLLSPHQACVKTDKAVKAEDYCSLLHYSKSMHMAVKLAQQANMTDLAQRMHALAEVGLAE